MSRQKEFLSFRSRSCQSGRRILSGRLTLAVVLVSEVAVFGQRTLAQCTLSFANAVNYTVGSAPNAIAVGDFNADGRPDLAVANVNSNFVSVLFSNPNGTFQPAVNVPAGALVYFVAASDLNGDGRPDLAVSSSGSAGVLLANGPPNVGTFQSLVYYLSGTAPLSENLFDINSDGRPDLIVVSPLGSGGGVDVLLGNGPPNTGTFQSPVHYSAGGNPSYAAIGDFNGDGHADLAVSNQSSSNVSILLANSDGTFQPAVNYPVNASPYGIATADFNGDGKLDLAVANFSHADVSILPGNGDGTFQPKSDYPAVISPRALALADFNGDGNMDVVVTNPYNQTVAILLGYSNGSFQSPATFAVGLDPEHVAVGDFNADGRPDMAVANNSAGGGTTISVLLNTGGPPAPTITQQPGANRIVNPGQSVTLSIAADGHGSTPTYQWRKNGVALANGGNISGADTPSLTINPTTPSDSGVYDARVTTPGCGNSILASTSDTVIVTVADPCDGLQPTISQQPASQSVFAGGTAAFSILATSPGGGGSLSYQWRKNGINISDGGSVLGTTSLTLMIDPVADSDGGAFDCLVSNGCGTTRSDPAGLGISRCRGDFNNDHSFDSLDIQGFVDALMAGQICP